jgi:SAM-dependent methyltransferase
MSDRNGWETRYGAGGDERQPSTFLVEHTHRLPPGRALDLACGTGRHALYLARHGWRVEAIDFARAGLQRLLTAARRQALPIEVVQADLEQFPLPTNSHDLIVNVRYLQRSLFAPIVASLRHGGVLLFETFIRDQTTLGHPRNPAFLLDRGELPRAFSSLALVASEEGRFETESGPAFLARLLARKRDPANLGSATDCVEF